MSPPVVFVCSSSGSPAISCKQSHSHYTVSKHTNSDPTPSLLSPPSLPLAHTGLSPPERERGREGRWYHTCYLAGFHTEGGGALLFKWAWRVLFNARQFSPPPTVYETLLSNHTHLHSCCYSRSSNIQIPFFNLMPKCLECTPQTLWSFGSPDNRGSTVPTLLYKTTTPT